MRVLFVAPYAPGRVRGRSYQFVRHLLGRGHQVTLVHPRWRGDIQNQVPDLEAAGARVVGVAISRSRGLLNASLALLTNRPMQSRYAWSPVMSRCVARELAASPPDVLHTEHLRASLYGLHMSKTPASARCVRVWDSVDCISGFLDQTMRKSPFLLWRLAARVEVKATRAYEALAAQCFDRVLVSSRQDLESLSEVTRHKLPPHRLAVVPGGVDLDAFQYREPVDRAPQVVFSGALSYHPNVAAALQLVEDIMPRVWASSPDVQVVVVGPSPPRRLRRLAARNPRRIRLTGWVASVSEHLAQAAVAAIPLPYGAGMQNKVLEAMACGTPVVTDPRTAGAIGATEGHELLNARTPPEFAQLILRLLSAPAERTRLARAARELVARRFTWERAVDALEAQYQSAREERS